MRILVAIPSYNCEKQIPRVLKGFADYPELLAKIEKIVVIDNRSPDHTIEAAKNAAKEYRLEDKFQIIRNAQNYGLGGSHKVAFLLAKKEKFDYVAILHGDNQATTSELEQLIEEAEKDPALSAVLGARFMSTSRLQGYSLLRILGNRALNFVYSLLAGRRTADMGSGLNLFKVSDLQPEEFCRFSDAFTFNMDLLLNYYSKHARLQFVPITWTEEDQVSNAKIFRVGWIALKTVFKWRFAQADRLDRLPGAYSYETV